MRIAATILLVLGVASCGNDSGAKLPNGCSGDYDKLMGAMCDLLSRCPDVYPIAYSNRDQCKAILCWATTCRLDAQRVGNDEVYTLQQTTPTVNAGDEQACLDWLGTVSCDQAKLGIGSSSSSSSSSSSGSTPQNPCSNVLGGGGSQSTSSTGCSSDSCAKGQYCSYGTVNADAGVRTCSVCVDLPKEGEHCDGQCAEGLYCDNHFTTSSFTCKTPEPDGSPCYENSTTNSPCQSGFCNFRTTTCDPNGKAGDPCTTPSDCRSNYCNAQMQCQDLHKKGESCTVDGDCENGRCDPTAHVCGLSDGSQCFSEVCLGYCDSSTSTCQSAKTNGSTCESDQECMSGFCAYQSPSSSTRACAVRCDDATPCPSGQLCNSFGACEAPQANGASCESDAECSSGHCNLDGNCADPPMIGAACTDSSACFPIGYCHAGTCAKQKQPGQACDAYDSCLAPYICLQSKCVLMNLSCAPASAGQMCAYLHVCDDQSYCDLASNFTCKPRKGAGATCSSDDECQKTLYCANGMCAARLAAGSACSTDSQCVDGVYCVMGSCTMGPAGQPCDRYDGPFCPDGYACPDNVCVAGTAHEGESCEEFTGPFCVAGLYCNAGMCAAKQPIGGSCYNDDACASGHCDSQSQVCLTSDMCVMP